MHRKTDMVHPDCYHLELMREPNVLDNTENEMSPQEMDLVAVKVTRDKLPRQKLSPVKSDIDKNLIYEPNFWYKNLSGKRIGLSENSFSQLEMKKRKNWK